MLPEPVGEQLMDEPDLYPLKRRVYIRTLVSQCNQLIPAELSRQLFRFVRAESEQCKRLPGLHHEE